MPISPDVAEGFYRLVDAAYEPGALAISSNLQPEGRHFTAPILLAVYAAATRKPSIPRMAAVSLAFGVPAADFMTAVVG